MSMSLTLSQPAKTEFGGRHTHDFSPRIPLAKSRLSPNLKPKIDSPVSSLRVSDTLDTKMATQHRGLPPPSAMIDQSRPPPSFHQQLGAMPDAPRQWQGQEDSMRNWLAAKAEEERRKQEEERTKQETLKLEQRRIEQTMLREALQGGVPPGTVPLIYAGMGSSQLAQVSLEVLQSYASQLQATTQQQIQQQQQSSPELRRETRLIGQAPSSYAQPQPPPILPSQHTEQPQLHATFSAYQPAPGRPPPTSAPRSATHTQLPRLTTNDMYVHQPTQQQGPGSAHPLQQSQTIQQDQPTSSPSIYFHHWVPPSESKSTQPQTPASKGEPLSAHPGSHLSESDYRESPGQKKRKREGPHQPAPPPSAGPQQASPSFSTMSSVSRKKSTHQRSGSNASMRDSESRPDSRRETELPQRSSQPESGQSSGEERRPSQPVEERPGRSSFDAQQDYRAERAESREPRS